MCKQTSGCIINSISFFRAKVKKNAEAPSLLINGPIGGISKDIHAFVNSYPHAQNWTGTDRVYMLKSIGKFAKERSERADLLNSPDIEAVHLVIAKLYYGFPPYIRQCVDDRLKPPIQFGLISGGGPGSGGCFSIPAGDAIHDFDVFDGDQLELRPGSHLARSIDKSPAPYRVEVADSHIACAAQGINTEGMPDAKYDGGLYLNVISQKAQNAALANYERTLPSGHPKPPIIGVQITTDPHNGYSYMGLELPAAIKRAQRKSDGKHIDGFSADVIRELSDTGEIFSTEKLAASKLFQSAFATLDKVFGEFNADWAEDKKNTAIRFWQRIQYLVENQPGFMRDFEADMFRLYPHLESKQDSKLAERMRLLELRHRSMLLITNAYSGYLENKDGYYSYGVHRGDIVVVLDNKSGPYKRQAYVVSKDDLNIGNSVALSCSLVRNDRVAGRTLNTTGVEMSADEFVNAPIEVYVKIETSGELSLQDKLFMKMYTVDRSPELDLDELLELGRISPSLHHSLVELRDTVATIFAQQSASIKQLREKGLQNVVDNKICVIPLLVDEHKKPLEIILEGIP